MTGERGKSGDVEITGYWPAGGSGSVSGGGNGGAAGSASSFLTLSAMLVETNGSLGGNYGERWINLGIVREIDPRRNLWVRLP